MKYFPLVVSCMILCCLLFGGVVAQDSKNLTNEERIKLAAENPLEEFQSRVSVEITTEKTEYMPYEPVIINYVLTNKVDFILRVPKYLEIEEGFIITNDSGQRMGPNIHTNCIAWDSILPYGSLSGSTDAGKKYELTVPGIYTCQFAPRGWKSNEIQIEVVEPTGDMQNVWLLFEEARALDGGCGDPKSEICKKAYSLYLKVVDDYPETFYAPMALHKAFYLHRLADRLIVREKSKEYIGKNVRKELLEYCFRAIIKTSSDLNDMAGGEAYLQSLIADVSNPEIAERASHWSERLHDHWNDNKHLK